MCMPWKFLPDHLEAVLALGLNLEIGVGGEDLDRVPRSEFRAMADRLHKSGCRLTLHAPFWDLSPGSIDPLIRQVSIFRMHQFFDLFTIFQPTQVVCHTGYDPGHHGTYREQWIERSLSVWEPLVERAERLKIPVLLENVWEHDPQLHRELMERVNSQFFGFCLDVGHQHSFSKSPLSVWLEALWMFLREIHMHDNDGSQDSHLPMGWGTIDFPLLFDFLEYREIAPLLTLEPHPSALFVDSVLGLERALRQSRWACQVYGVSSF